MCGIAGTLELSGHRIPDLAGRLAVMNAWQRHRGPDGEGAWSHSAGHVGLAHRRLSIIDLSAGGHQPMTDAAGNWITFNGEIYNYLELRAELGDGFKTSSDTEVILAAYRKWGQECLVHLRGMFAFAIWDEARSELFCARDRFGIKPFCYATVENHFYFASEAKAILPFLPVIATDGNALKDYLAFQFCLAGKTLFKGVQELLPGHLLTVRNGQISTRRYWEVYYDVDFTLSSEACEERIHDLLEDSIRFHLRSDVPVGAYVSGGIDSSSVAILARRERSSDFLGFTGKFALGPDYDESEYARIVAEAADFDLHEVTITAADFVNEIQRVIYHLDCPVAGPGAFPQFMVARLAASHRKVVLGGQGGDEVFGGYARYLIAYFEQCIKAAIDGTSHSGRFVVTYESIIPNLTSLRQYKPLLKEFWREGLFEDMDRRYFRLVNRSSTDDREIDWCALGDYSPFSTFQQVFHGPNVKKEAYFDLMTHFDFKTLLPALLHVEDRVSMAHGLESRVPLLDHPLVEFAATIPADVKFKDGRMKHVLKNAVRQVLPPRVWSRTDKMGFPTPVIDFARGEAREFVHDVFTSQAARGRALIDNRRVLESLEREPKFGRKFWGVLSLELWQQAFHDRAHAFQQWSRPVVGEHAR